ncbi:CDP-diacylglycerol--serine O-phosphatidyltransferase [Candidatus Profftia lariciata]|uniref:CDP-diacylglycerol--serine O-phosphatidyltransferase n=1 Tax=Candidatus Profftia lariciata TaxID=1987921 RepID=UPI001D022E6D|nr:CDP-diacylglycerol--serine O-phosphatidyltransferase [Candidatus Profftia lariciata]UDG81254.1 CDP-diacylglycerol--serine O-phosphatidyltransferase [Candidatus Profftia lariciata]
MLYTFKSIKHKQHLLQLPKLPQIARNLQTLFFPNDFRTTLIKTILHASRRIYITALYLENDDGGQDILNALYFAKKQRPNLEIYVLVDWHRAQRGLIGAHTNNINADWYCSISDQYSDISVPIYGVPIHVREAFGVFHFKGFIIDEIVLYSGASLNNTYLHRHDEYRYDRYHVIHNSNLANTMSMYIQNTLLTNNLAHRLDHNKRPKSAEIRHKIRKLRYNLRYCSYDVASLASNNELAVTPLVGLGKHSILNKTIHHLMCSVEVKMILCTPYFNMPSLLISNIIKLLRQHKQIEIIVGDKKANDFYIPEEKPFKMISILPYFYEINLRRFINRLQNFINNGQLIVRIWQNAHHTFHIKGIWIDNEWQLITGNNLNPRAWNLDLENAILIHDPKNQLYDQHQKELQYIRKNTYMIQNYIELETIQNYPIKVKKLIKRLSSMRIDRIISRIL